MLQYVVLVAVVGASNMDLHVLCSPVYAKKLHTSCCIYHTKQYQSPSRLHQHAKLPSPLACMMWSRSMVQLMLGRNPNFDKFFCRHQAFCGRCTPNVVKISTLKSKPNRDEKLKFIRTIIIRIRIYLRKGPEKDYEFQIEKARYNFQIDNDTEFQIFI